MNIKSFRKSMATNEINRIRLSTNNGLMGYRINKFQVISGNPVSESDRWVLKIFTTEKDETGTERTPTVTVNFDDPTLLAVGVFSSNENSQIYPEDMTIVFDNMKINQDIFVTAKAESGTRVNYYLELEQMKLSKDEATVATLKDMRAGPDTNFGP